MTISFDVSTSSNAIRSPLDVYQNYPNSKGGKEFGKVLGGYASSWKSTIFKYLKKTMDYGLEYNRDPSVLEGYADASWITDQEDYVYQNYPTARELRKALEVRFFMEDATRRLSRHTCSTGMEYWDAVNRVFKYLKKTIPYGLEYNGDPSVLEGYTDASWITDQEDYQSLWHWLHATKKHNGYETCYENCLDKVHLSECGIEAASYEFKGLALNHSKKPR
ncbi:hypothetical protein Tco_0780419 [Tanacetum coccineum]